MRHPFVSSLLAAAFVASCQGGAPTRGKAAGPKPAASRPAGPGQAGPSAPAIAADAPAARPIAPTDAVVRLTGKVKLLSDKGGGIVSNNGAGVLSNNGGGIVSNNGGGIVSNNGGGIVSNNGGGVVANNGAAYRLRQAAAPAEWLLADARVEVLDAAGRILVGPDGAPIGGTTDEAGRFAFSAGLPDENLVLRIKLWQGGELTAFRTRGSADVAVDTASTLGTAYVLAEYVKADPEVLGRLPRAEADALHDELEAARGQLAGYPAYRPAEMVRATADLRAKAATVDARLERIKAILVLGQKDLGMGLKATEVPLARPVGQHRDAAGNLYVAEDFGRVRRIDPQGRVRLYAGIGAAPETGVADLPAIGAMTGLPDGTLYLHDADVGRVLRIAPGGPATVVAGGPDRVGGVRLEGRYIQLATGPDRALYVPTYGPGGNHLHRLAADGGGSEVSLPDIPAGHVLRNVAVGPDAMYVLTQPGEAEPFGSLLWRRVGEGAWSAVPPPPGRSWIGVGGLAATAGGAYLAGGDGAEDGRLYRVAPDGTSELVWGEATTPIVDGGAARGAHLIDFIGLAPDAGGGVLLSAHGIRRVIAIDAAGVLRYVAGVDPSAPIQPGRAVPVSGPAGVVFDAAGRMVVAEAGGAQIKRLSGDRLETIAGGGGLKVDPDPLKSLLYAPNALAYAGADLYFLDATHQVLRKLAADGTLSYAAGKPVYEGSGQSDGTRIPAAELDLLRPTALVADREGRPVFADAGLHTIFRLAADGHAEVIAGASSGGPASRTGDEGDGAAATAARLNAPAGLAYDAAGNLYVADALNGRIRRIGTDGKIETFAGIPLAEGLGRLVANQLDAGPVAAREALLVVPSALCFDKAGNLYVAELGTTLTSKLGSASELLAGLPKVMPSIRKITPDGRATLVAGRGATALAGQDGGDVLVAPGGLAIDPAGNLIVTDSAAGLVLQIPAAALR